MYLTKESAPSHDRGRRPKGALHERRIYPHTKPPRRGRRAPPPRRPCGGRRPRRRRLWCAEALCRSGVGGLTLIDSDTVAESNINRQLEALHSSVGRPKAEILAERCRDISAGTRVRAVQALYCAESRDILPDCDYIADCIDLVSCKLESYRDPRSAAASP